MHFFLLFTGPYILYAHYPPVYIVDQVRPKPATPTPTSTVPIAPAPPPPMLAAPQLLQRPVMLTTKLTSTSLASTTGPIHQVRIVNGQPCASITKTLPSAQLTGIVITSPATITATLATHQTLQIRSLSPDTKVRGGGTKRGRANLICLNYSLLRGPNEMKSISFQIISSVGPSVVELPFSLLLNQEAPCC